MFFGNDGRNILDYRTTSKNHLPDMVPIARSSDRAPGKSGILFFRGGHVRHKPLLSKIPTQLFEDGTFASAGIEARRYLSN